MMTFVTVSCNILPVFCLFFACLNITIILDALTINVSDHVKRATSCSNCEDNLSKRLGCIWDVSWCFIFDNICMTSSFKMTVQVSQIGKILNTTEVWALIPWSEMSHEVFFQMGHLSCIAVFTLHNSAVEKLTVSETSTSCTSKLCSHHIKKSESAVQHSLCEESNGSRLIGINQRQNETSLNGDSINEEAEHYIEIQHEVNIKLTIVVFQMEWTLRLIDKPGRHRRWKKQLRKCATRITFVLIILSCLCFDITVLVRRIPLLWFCKMYVWWWIMKLLEYLLKITLSPSLSSYLVLATACVFESLPKRRKKVPCFEFMSFNIILPLSTVNSAWFCEMDSSFSRKMSLSSRPTTDFTFQKKAAWYFVI